MAEVKPGHCWSCGEAYLKPADGGGTLIKGRGVVFNPDRSITLNCQGCKRSNRFRPTFLLADRGTP